MMINLLNLCYILTIRFGFITHSWRLNWLFSFVHEAFILLFLSSLTYYWILVWLFSDLFELLKVVIKSSVVLFVFIGLWEYFFIVFDWILLDIAMNMIDSLWVRMVSIGVQLVIFWWFFIWLDSQLISIDGFMQLICSNSYYIILIIWIIV